MAKEAAAQTYAQAIFGQAIQGWLDALKSVNSALQQSGLPAKLDDSSTSYGRKEELIRGVIPAKANPEVGNLIRLLASKNHVHLLPEIIAEFDRRSQQGAGSHNAQVTSAIDLTDSEKHALEAKLQAKFGRDTVVEYAVNPEIIGGVIVRFGDKLVDGSVAGKLAALKEKLTA